MIPIIQMNLEYTIQVILKIFVRLQKFHIYFINSSQIHVKINTITAKSKSAYLIDFDTNTVQVSKKKSYEYKVLSQKDKWFSGKFDPLKLEEALNAYAEQGWRVIGCATADFPSFGGPRQELIALLEREK